MSGNTDIKKYLENLSKRIEPNIDAGLLGLLNKIPNYSQKTYCFRSPLTEYLKLISGEGNKDGNYLSAIIVMDDPANATGLSVSRTNSSILLSMKKLILILFAMKTATMITS